MFVSVYLTPRDRVEGNEINATLISTITKAFAWQEELEAGEHDSIEGLAKAKNVGRTYAGRVLRLTSLAPELVEDVFNGDENGLMLRKLHRGIAYHWAAQQSEFTQH